MITQIKGWLAALGLALVAALGAWLKGRSRGRADVQAREDAATIDTIRKVQDAKDRSRDAGGDWRERLRRSKRD